MENTQARRWVGAPGGQQSPPKAMLTPAGLELACHNEEKQGLASEELSVACFTTTTLAKALGLRFTGSHEGTVALPVLQLPTLAGPALPVLLIPQSSLLL